MKQPKNLPKVGDRVKLRGRTPKGELLRVTEGLNWANVQWDENDGPKVVHLFELEKLK